MNIYDRYVNAELMLIRSFSYLPYKVGCSIYSSNNLLVGYGYNATITENYIWLKNYDRMKMARGFTDEFPVDFEEVVHAEAMAIAKLDGNASGCTMYCTLEPCVPCAEYVINSRQIVEFRYLWDYADERKHKAHLFESGVPLLEKAGIKVGRIETC
jgi:deoxycytidylate deaminase